jgi:hypothetical protein
VAGQVFDVLVLCVYYFGQLATFDHLFVNVHFDYFVEFRVGFDVVANYFGDG